jgi:hypothetical protein
VSPSSILNTLRHALGKIGLLVPFLPGRPPCGVGSDEQAGAFHCDTTQSGIVNDDIIVIAPGQLVCAGSDLGGRHGQRG